MSSPPNHRGLLRMCVCVIIFVRDSRIEFVSFGAKLDPAHVLLRVGRGAAEIRRSHVPIPEVERVGCGDDEEADFRVERHRRNDARGLHAPRLAPALGGEMEGSANRR